MEQARAMVDPSGEALPVLRLASASPRRRLIMRLAGIPCVVCPAGVTEDDGASGVEPAGVAKQNARRKTLAAALQAAGRPPAWTLGADTIVVLGTRILGKPGDAEDARSMIRDLAGRTHIVITAWALAGQAAGIVEEGHSSTRVAFRDLTRDRVEDYVRAMEWTDKAGGYAIQGLGAALIGSVDGDPFNVMGLPIGDVVDALLRWEVIPRHPLV